MLVLVACAAQFERVFPEIVLVLRTVGCVATGALLIAVCPGFDVLHELAVLGMAAQAEVGLPGSEQRRCVCRMWIVAHSALVTIRRNMTESLPIALADVFVAANTEAVDRTLQIEAGLAPDVGMARLTIVGCKRGVLERHHESRRPRSVGIMTGGAVGSLQLVSLVDTGKFVRDGMAFRAQFEGAALC